MRAIAAATLGSLANYAEIEIPAPEPGPGQVPIRVAAVGVGYVDALVALGRYQVKPALPHIPGSEVAGTIDAVGADAGNRPSDSPRAWAIGDRVFALAANAFAEQALAPAARCRKVPDGATIQPKTARM
jgi:NADPH2:quinone reductase